MPLNSDRRRDLIQFMPESAIVNREWLSRKGLSRHAVDNLAKSGVLHSLAHGVYVREGGLPSWGDIVYYLQWVLRSDLTVGSLTALELQGQGHYLPVSGKTTVRLYGNDKLPSWINNLVPGVQFLRFPLSQLTGRPHTLADQELMLTATRLYSWRDTREGLRMATAERAIFEVLTEVPRSISFEHAEALMQGLTTLSPRRMQQLLTACQNIKVNRLFYFLAEKNNFSWLSKIDRSAIDFGSGKRVVEKNGSLDPNYLITVPKRHD